MRTRFVPGLPRRRGQVGVSLIEVVVGMAIGVIASLGSARKRPRAASSTCFIACARPRASTALPKPSRSTSRPDRWVRFGSCSIRRTICRLAAWYVAQAIIELSLLHEMTQVLNGHCGFLKELLGVGKSQLVCLNETNAAANGLDADTLRWLEDEADFYAASYLTHDVISGRDTRRLGISGFDTKTRIALMTFAMCLLAAIWSKDHKAEPGSGRHPHPLTRALTYLHGIALALLNHGDETMRKGYLEGLTNVFVLGNYIPQMRKLGELVDMGSHWRERDAYQDPASPLKPAVERHMFKPEVAGSWPPPASV